MKTFRLWLAKKLLPKEYVVIDEEERKKKKLEYGARVEELRRTGPAQPLE